MYLIQLLLPLSDNRGERFARAPFEEVERQLVAKFDGFTAYPRAPASGLWISPSDNVKKDDMVIYEVLVKTLDNTWWASYRRELEIRFQQEAIHIRATSTELL